MRIPVSLMSSAPKFALRMAEAASFEEADKRPRRPEAMARLDGAGRHPDSGREVHLREHENHDEFKRRQRESRRASRGMTRESANQIQTNPNDLLVQNSRPQRTLRAGSVLALVITVPFVLAACSLVTTCSAAYSGVLEGAEMGLRAGAAVPYGGGGGGQLLPPMDTAELIGADQLDQHEMLATGELRLVGQADDWPISQQQAAPFEQHQQVDWGQRLFASPPNKPQSWPVGQQLAQNLHIHQQQQQQSPLTRAIEATRTFMRQQQQQLANATMLQQPVASSAHLNLTPAASHSASQQFRHDEALLRQPASSSAGAAGSPLHVANKLYNFLFQPKAAAAAGPSLLSSGLAQSLVEVRRKMSQPPTGGAVAAGTAQEPFQYASSENNFRHSTSGSREQRSLITLSAPYEQHQQAASTRSLEQQAAAAAASSNESSAEPQFQWQVESLRGVGEEASDEQLADSQRQQPESEQMEPANEHETSQQQQQQQNGTMQWNLGGQEEERAEIERHQPETQQQQQMEQLPEDEQQIVMVGGGGEIYEQMNETQAPESNRLPGRAIEGAHNETGHLLVPANETFDTEPNPQGQPPDETPEANLTEGADASLQGDESLLAVQLPSQYDSVIGVPPEGHYDDYFKPLINSASSTSSEQAPPLRGSAPNSASENSSSQQQQSSSSQSASRLELSQAELRGQFLVGGGERQQDSRRQHHQPAGASSAAHQFANSNLSASSFYPTAEFGSSTSANSSAASDQLAGVGLNQSLASSTGQRSTGGGSPYQIVPGRDSHQNRSGSSDDGIQLIVANSRGELQDPNTNEKVITYTSENGQDSFARLVGKPARHTFFNKDLNEIPAATPRPSSAPPTPLNHAATTSRRPTRSPQPPVAPAGPKLALPSGQTPTGQLEEVYEMVLEPAEEAAAAPVEPVEQQVFGQYAAGLSNRADYKLATGAPSRFVSQNQRQPAQNKPPGGRHTERGPKNMATNQHQNHHHHQQQTIPRPQVTEAKFSLKDLPLNAPTESPSLSESTTRAIEELPSRAKRLREADKNELMNELLAALDRVKAAIYKLQPLTAKMNAIYRKSVTSNTRDQILDNNKGTYAKRYPPGDYDDAYDRMHPSELVASGRQRRFSGRSSSGGAANGTARNRSQQRDRMEAGDSQTSLVYLPAPREMSARGGAEPGAGRVNGTKSRPGLSRRAGELEGGDSSRAWRLAVGGGGGEADQESPMFGYRITIYQSPGVGGEPGESQQLGAEAREKQILSYSLIDDGRGQPVEFSSVVEGDPIDSMATSESSLVAQVEGDGDGDGDEDEDEGDYDAGGAPTQMEASESGKAAEVSEQRRKKHQKEGKESVEKGAKRAKKAQGKKGGEKHSKQQHKGKKGQEEHKKQKVFKKIKHHKGVTSKESHKLHRDKHIKAHDRGAAKEKALKERTQIEFFEREQIVDDEFEKGKKSTIKAGWASGHDSKKSSSEIGGGGHGHGHDSMSMGGSQQVDRVLEQSQTAASASSLAPMMVMEAAASDEHGKEAHASKGQGHSVASSSGKQSNKFEKKHMEARGKKFKGWREKGYKIITETEFIDRGSLHDSAYKKRDKGAAHHQKFKKHEAKSEGHEGKMHEMHKKSHKKEEKSHKSAEKKHELSGKEEEGGKKSGKKAAKKEREEQEKKRHEKKKASHADHDQEESMLNTRSEPLQRMKPKAGANFSDGHQLPVQLITKVLNQLSSRSATNRNEVRPESLETGERLPISGQRSIEAAATGVAGNKSIDRPAGANGTNKTASERPQRQKDVAPGRNQTTTLASSNAATLRNIITRLNATRSGDTNKPLDRQSTSSLVRLVNTLAQLNQTSQPAAVGNQREPARRPAGSGGGGGEQLRERLPPLAIRVQFDEQPVAQRQFGASSVAAPMKHEARKLQDSGRNSPGALQMIAEPSERPYFARLPAPPPPPPPPPPQQLQSRWPLVGQNKNVPPLPPSAPLGLKHQQFLYDTPQDGALAFVEPPLVADYDTLLGLGPAGFQQQQQQRPEVGQRQQPQLQPFSFLAD